jgi:Na+-transporting methylmalonyl-CoA/oxaloacetate decarboxylase gamma subunit
MTDLAFGLTMTVMGMGVTFITLCLLTLLIRLLIKLFPRLIRGRETYEDRLLTNLPYQLELNKVSSCATF